MGGEYGQKPRMEAPFEGRQSGVGGVMVPSDGHGLGTEPKPARAGPHPTKPDPYLGRALGSGWRTSPPEPAHKPKVGPNSLWQLQD